MILGISISHNASVAVTSMDGIVVEALEEERVTRIKGYWGIPVKSIDLMSQKYSIDEIVIGSHLKLSLKEMEIFESQLVGNPSNPIGRYSKPFPGFSSSFSQGNPNENLGNLVLSIVRKHHPNRNIPISWVEHHDSHIGSALGLFQEDSIIFSFDGNGDGLSSKIYISKKLSNPELTKINETHRNNSLGSLYSAVTSLYNFKPNSHEGKITGLAAFGSMSQANDYLNSKIKVKDGSISLKIPQNSFSRLIFKIFNYLMRKLVLPITIVDIALIASSKTKNYADLAFAIQKTLEDSMAKVVNFHVLKNGITNISLTGGVFANVKLNSVLAGLDSVEKCRVFPNMGDGGISLGCIWFLLAKRKELSVGRLYKDMFLGPINSHTKDEIDLLVHEGDIEVSEIDGNSITLNIVEDLTAGLIVGIHRGRMEFGPRALGHRSIIANPNLDNVNAEINKRLKRTEFMPLAPIICAEAFDVYFEPQKDMQPFEYMTMTANVKSEYLKRLGGVVHIDGTARPQIVTIESDEYIYRILKSFGDKNGVYALINTSFNVHEQPINYELNDSVSVLKSGGVDVIYTEKFKLKLKKH